MDYHLIVFTIKKKEKMIMKYNTNCSELLNRLYQQIEQTFHKDPHPGLIIAIHNFNKPYPLVTEIALLCLATMDLLIQFAYPKLYGYAKFTISFTMKQSYGEEITYTLGPAIPLTSEDCQLIPMSDVYFLITRSLKIYAEKYDGMCVVRLMIRVYMDGKKIDIPSLSEDERYSKLSSIIEGGLREIEPIEVRKIQHSKRSYPKYITAIKPYGRTKLKSFIVADTETILINDVHKPYAAGLMMVRPGEEINKMMIDIYFSEDYSIIFDSFEERSTKVLYDLVKRIERIVRQEHEPLTIYFHNFSRFDGILILKHLACHHKSYKLKPLMRNNMLYELSVYSGKKKLFRFVDSLNLLPGALSNLAMNLCPDLGQKGSIEYEKLNLSNITSMKKTLIDYLKQDILLLGGVMQKAQEIYWKLFKVDIESKITISSLALYIYRLKYYDASNCPIYIPNKNEDSFIRRAYYGGHTDSYKPYGENLYYYDVNSLYPFVMMEFPMPGGEPVWNSNLNDKDLDSIFGFIEAYVVCPKTIKKPFLPYRDKNNTLIFPTGEFVGVFYSEELKYAKSIGYTVIPISGYLFEKMEKSPFREFVSSLYESRLEAKKEGNDAFAYVYKILMNSLYGRFGINPKSTTTDVVDEERQKELMRLNEFIFSYLLTDNTYVVSYHSNTGTDLDYWNPPKNSAVQLAAAITASARIYMYPYISREDCYYTDTDSVVLGMPLPESVLSSSIIGKFKLEDRIVKGFFLAPKAYYYSTLDEREVLKFKGPAKKLVNKEWFIEQYKDPHRKKLQVKDHANFRIDRYTLEIKMKEILIGIGIQLENKRKPVFNNKNIWIDSEPIDVKDLTPINNIAQEIIKFYKLQLKQKEIEIQELKKERKNEDSNVKEIEERKEEKEEKERKEVTKPPLKRWTMFPDLEDNEKAKATNEETTDEKETTKKSTDESTELTEKERTKEKADSTTELRKNRERKKERRKEIEERMKPTLYMHPPKKNRKKKRNREFKKKKKPG